MSKSSNDFTKLTREALSKRAGQMCSRPGCQQPTVGPHKDPKKFVDLGEACHIRGARPGSARYDQEMTSAERRCITNAIWLCRTCGKMIDSDPIKFTVGRLYSWKMQHEASMERRQEGTSYTEELLDAELRPFLNEPPGARQVALDRPSGWEYLLTIELLRPKLKDVFRDLADLEADLILRPSSAFSVREFGARFQEVISDMSRGGAALATLINSRLPKAYGQAGEAGDPLAILHACNQLEETCRFLLETEARVRALVWPEVLEHLREDLLGWNSQNILQMQRIVDEISDAVEDALKLDEDYDGPPIVRKINLTLTLPEQYKRFIEKMNTLDFEQIALSEFSA